MEGQEQQLQAALLASPRLQQYVAALVSPAALLDRAFELLPQVAPSWVVEPFTHACTGNGEPLIISFAILHTNKKGGMV